MEHLVFLNELLLQTGMGTVCELARAAGLKGHTQLYPNGKTKKLFKNSLVALWQTFPACRELIEKEFREEWRMELTDYLRLSTSTTCYCGNVAKVKTTLI